jgi:hypothetical protein
MRKSGFIVDESFPVVPSIILKFNLKNVHLVVFLIKISIDKIYWNNLSKLLLQSTLPVVAEHSPAGASFRTWFQFIQNYLAGRLVAGSCRSSPSGGNNV